VRLTKTAASTRDQIDGRSIVIWVVIAGSSWSCDDGGEGHDGLGVLMEVACFRICDCDRERRSSGSELLGVVACDLDQGQVVACVVQGKE
jgi:hypothetical protein